MRYIINPVLNKKVIQDKDIQLDKGNDDINLKKEKDNQQKIESLNIDSRKENTKSAKKNSLKSSIILKK